MRKVIVGLVKAVTFCCFLIALALFSGVVTVRYIFATSRVEIPDLVGKDLEYATNLLAERHLQLKTVERQIDPKLAEDHIIAQDPRPGTKTKKNQMIRVVVSGGIETVTVPDVIGKSWNQAKRLLRQNKFRIGHVAYAHSAEVPVDTIVAQTPFAQTDASIGTTVDLLVSRGSYKKVMVMPDLVEQNLAYAVGVIEKLGLVLGKVEHEEYDIPPNTVLSHVPRPGALVEEQNMVSLVVSGTAGQTGHRVGSASQIQYQSLEYTVPPGPFEREVSVLVKNIEGIKDIYHVFGEFDFVVISEVEGLTTLNNLVDKIRESENVTATQTVVGAEL